jgi:hypothetical protein
VHCTVTGGFEANALGAAECMSEAHPESMAPRLSMQAHFQPGVIFFLPYSDGLARSISSLP